MVGGSRHLLNDDEDSVDNRINDECESLEISLDSICDNYSLKDSITILTAMKEVIEKRIGK